MYLRHYCAHNFMLSVDVYPLATGIRSEYTSFRDIGSRGE